MLFSPVQNVYFDLDTSFHVSYTTYLDCLYLSDSPDNIIPEAAHFIFRSTSLQDFVNEAFGGVFKDFWDEVMNYHGKSKLIIYLRKPDFTRLVLTYFRELYRLDDVELEKVYRIVCENISFIHAASVARPTDTIWSPKHGLIHCAMGDDALKAMIPTIGYQGLFTPELKKKLTFEPYFADWCVNGYDSPYYPQLEAYLKEMALDEMRYFFLEIKDFIVRSAYDFEKMFPDIPRKATLYETFQHPLFEFLFDPKVIDVDGANQVEDYSDVYHAIEKYEPRMLELFERTMNYLELPDSSETGNCYVVTPNGMVNSYICRQYPNGFPSIKKIIASQLFETFIGIRLKAVKENNFRYLIEDKHWLNLTSQFRLYRRKINFMLVNYFNDMKNAGDKNLSQYSLVEPHEVGK